MTKIIGLQNGDDAGAALIIDGKIISAVNEERFVRIKLFKGFPHKSIKYLLDLCNLKIEDIDYFVYGWFEGKNYPEIIPKLCERAMLSADDPEAKDVIKKRLEVEYESDCKTREEALNELSKLKVSESKIKFIEHHESHAWAAFSTSKFDEALVVTADGRGDSKSFTVSVANAEGIKEIDWLSTFDSLGFLYGQITHFLGYKPHRHEGKVTGLAAYGNPENTRSVMNKMMTWKHNQIFANLGKWYKPFFTNQSEELVSELKKYSKEDIAAGVQNHTEEMVVKFIKKHLKKNPSKNICLAGGIFANVRVNQKIMEIDGVENIYVHPNMGDGGLPLGAAIAYDFKINGNKRFDLPTVYLGPEFSNEEILKELEKHDTITFKKLDNKAKIVSQLIQDNKIVGLFNGKMEYGPRALGNRTIIYHTRDNSVNDWLNKRLHRTEFMPFAPVVIEELANKSFIGWKKDHFCSHFMTVTYDCTEEFKTKHPAVTHVDGTARPQIITREENPDYYDIVKQYCEDTGDFALINTSFNQHEEPILCFPENAVDAVLNDSVDVLIIGNYMVEKK